MNKNSAVIYYDWLAAFESLSDAEAKQLITSIIKFSMTGEEMSDMSQTLKMAWVFIKPTLQRDEEKYEQKCRQLVDNGRKGGEAKRKNEKSSSKQLQANGSNCLQIGGDNDNVNDNVNVSVNESVSDSGAHAHGKYRNVILSDEKYKSFADSNSSAEAIIDELSEKIKLKPREYSGPHDVWLDIFARNFRPLPPKQPVCDDDDKPSYDVEKAIQRSLNINPNKTKRS